MENLKIEVTIGNELRESLEIQDLFIELGYKSKNHFNGIENHASCFYVADESGRFWSCGAVKFNNIDAKQVGLPELRAMVTQKRKQPDAAASPNETTKKEYLLPTDHGYELCLCEEGMTIHESWINIPEGAEIAVLFEPKITSSRYGELFFWKDNGDTHYIVSERSGYQRPTGWYSCKGNMLTTLDEFLRSWKNDCRIVWKRDQPATSLNNIAKTAEVHREHNLSNELNDLCAEFGCPPGADRMRWLRDHLRGTRKRETLYHYSASINTARGTVAYDGVITFSGRITGMEDYQQARAEIAKDGNVAPEQVNVHSLSVIN